MVFYNKINGIDEKTIYSVGNKAEDQLNKKIKEKRKGIKTINLKKLRIRKEKTIKKRTNNYRKIKIKC